MLLIKGFAREKLAALYCLTEETTERKERLSPPDVLLQRLAAAVGGAAAMVAARAQGLRESLLLFAAPVFADAAKRRADGASLPSMLC